MLCSAVLSTPPHFPHLPNSPIVQGEGSSPGSVCPRLSTSAELCLEMIKIFDDLRHLTDLLTSSHHSMTLMEVLSFDKIRFSIQHRLLSLKIRKPNQKVQDLDYLLEACRIAALIFLHRVPSTSWPVRSLFRQMKSQLKELLLEKGSQNIQEIKSQLHRGYYTWVLFIGGIHSQDDEDTAFFARRTAILTRVWQAQGFGSWPETLSRIKGICWTNALQGPECERFGKQVERFIRIGDDGQDLISEQSAHLCWPVDLDPVPQ